MAAVYTRRDVSRRGGKDGAGIRGSDMAAMMEDAREEARAADAALKGITHKMIYLIRFSAASSRKRKAPAKKEKQEEPLPPQQEKKVKVEAPNVADSKADASSSDNPQKPLKLAICIEYPRDDYTVVASWANEIFDAFLESVKKDKAFSQRICAGLPESKDNFVRSDEDKIDEMGLAKFVDGLSQDGRLWTPFVVPIRSKFSPADLLVMIDVMYKLGNGRVYCGCDKTKKTWEIRGVVLSDDLSTLIAMFTECR